LQAEAAADKLSPVDYMLKVMRDETQPAARRDWAAQAVAPYVNPRLAVIDSRITKEVEVTSLNDAERRAQARRMIEEAFAEREPQHVIAGKPMLRVIEHEAVDTEANGEEPTEREG
jgi:hypothetical protein